MGLYLPNMDMPKSCYECPLQDDECFGSIKCQYVKTWGSERMRAVDCPLVSVPPHGRLIDADALINALQDLFNKRAREAEFSGNRGACVTWNDAIYHIKSAPTIIPADPADEEGEE